MLKIRSVAVASLCLVGSLTAVHLNASDPVAVYARVDRVVMAPDQESPRTIQIFGVFALATRTDPNGYQPPARGYLYFTLPGDDARARREWNDLKEVAGTKQIVAFGSRYRLQPRLRAAADTPDSPDAYTVATGINKVNGTTDYPPIRGLVDFRH